MEPIAAADAFWLHADAPENLLVINGLLALDGHLELTTLKQTVQDGLLRFPRFRRHVVHSGGRAHWGGEQDFDADRHFEETTLSGPVDERALQDFVSQRVSEPLPESLPLWRVHLVHGHPRGSAIVVRVHHCVADGIALVSVLLSMAQQAHEGPTAEAPEPVQGILQPALQRVRGALAHTSELVHQGWRFVEHLAPQEVLRHGHDLATALSKLATLSAQDHPTFKGRLGAAKAVSWSEPMPLDKIKALGKRLDGKVNDVLVAMAAGALRRYLLSRDQPVNDEVLRATVPVNLRPLSEAHKLGNRFGLVFLHLPIHLEDPRARFDAVRAEMNEIKGGAEAMAAFGLIRAMGAAPAPLEAQAVDLFSRKTSMVLTNVPGPRQPLLFAGRPLRRVMFWVPASGSVSMGLSIISYVDHVMVGVQVDRGLVPDPHQVTDAMNHELQHMLQVL